MEDVLRIAAASKRFGETPALSGADVELRAGEWLALLGPNGAGKTTLVRAVAGRVRLDDGTITLFGHRLTGGRADRDVRGKLGIVPQEIALYPALTAAENLHAFGSLAGLRGKELGDRVEHALTWTGLADRAGSRTSTFSGGMKRRLNIACSVLHDPKVILLDEPTVGVDPQSRQRIWDMLEELRRDGASLLLTTHQLDEAQSVSDRIVIIDHGKVIASGTFAELLHETIGAKQRVTFHLADDPPADLRGQGFQVTDRTLARSIDDAAREIPRLLEAIGDAGAEVLDMHLQAPTLQAVFIHLTGRELRE
jgi:linearmycin/streptolysin S transport system ATP-binding protein